MSKTSQIARAIDVGFGRVKFTLDDERSAHFPSLALPSSVQVDTLGSRARDTFDVPVGAESFEVGNEIALAQTGHDYGRSISEGFYATAQYEALVKGALNYMHAAGDRAIDVLVLGLPVTQWFDAGKRDFLCTKYATTHDLGQGRSMVVRQVAVQAQPMGGYVEMGRHLAALNAQLSREGSTLGEVTALSKLNVLVIDPGEFTLDWLLMRHGSLTKTASGAASAAGRHRIVSFVKEQLERKIGRGLPPSSLDRINEAMRLNQPLRIAGVNYDLSEFDSAVQTVAEDPVRFMLDSLGGSLDLVDLVVVVGGAPERYRDALRTRLPQVPTFVIEPSITANVQGFQRIAAAIAHGMAA